MSLTDSQIYELGEKMGVPIADVCFKDELESPLEYNKAYIINMQDSVDESGQTNPGTHWVYLQIVKYPNGSDDAIYFDPYGVAPPENVKEEVKKTIGKGLPYTNKDVQSLMNNACGFYCLALGHFINASKYRSGVLDVDVELFLDLFDDLNKSVDWLKNEYILKHFFRSSNPELRKQIEVIKPTHSIVDENSDKKFDPFKTGAGTRIPVELKHLKK